MTTAPGTASPAELVIGGHSKGVHEARALGFMPRILVLTTLPHSRPTTCRFERINGRYSLCLEACFQRQRPIWNPELVLSRQFFHEITRSAVPVHLRAIERLKGSPLAIDTYIWLTYRMSYLRRPCLIP